MISTTAQRVFKPRIDPNNSTQCPDSPTGAHHWFIAECRGEDASPGVCRYCGSRGMFPNYLPLEFKKWELD